MKKADGLIWIVLSLILLGGSLTLLYTTYRRVQAPIQQASHPIRVQGVVTEKLVEQRSDRLLPFKVTTYVVRYAFPNARGQMRTGEQVVTRRFYESITRQGEPIWVFLSADDASVNAVDIRLVFPGAAGWRIGIGLAGLVLATATSTAGFALTRARPSAGGPEQDARRR